MQIDPYLVSVSCKAKEPVVDYSCRSHPKSLRLLCRSYMQVQILPTGANTRDHVRVQIRHTGADPTYRYEGCTALSRILRTVDPLIFTVNGAYILFRDMVVSAPK